jgi:hypothetical protein
MVSVVIRSGVDGVRTQHTQPIEQKVSSLSLYARAICFALVDLDSLLVLCVTFRPAKAGDFGLIYVCGAAADQIRCIFLERDKKHNYMGGHGHPISPPHDALQMVQFCSPTRMTKVLLLVVQQQYKVRHEQVQRTELPAGVSLSQAMFMAPSYLDGIPI